LAELYHVSTGTLNKAVKRNVERFPDDFMFRLTKEEMSLIFQNGISKKRGGVRKVSQVFTEQGIAMLSSVLKSRHAMQVNIQIMRAFIRLREIQESQKQLLNQLNKHEVKLLQHDRKFEDVFRALDDMQRPPDEPKKKKIGFTPS
jgi:hypothetical protein